jgi:hypothetical protein
MATSARFRAQAEASREEAQHQDDASLRSTLICMARSWTTLANQTDRLLATRLAADCPPRPPERRMRKLMLPFSVVVELARRAARQ